MPPDCDLGQTDSEGELCEAERVAMQHGSSCATCSTATWQSSRRWSSTDIFVMLAVGYRSEPRQERLTAVARVPTVAETVSTTPGADAWVRWCGLTVCWSGSLGLRLPSRLLCTGIEQVPPWDRRGSRARCSPSPRRCASRTRLPPVERELPPPPPSLKKAMAAIKSIGE